MADDSSKRDSSHFRRAALDYHLHRTREGALLRLAPAWSRFAYWLLLLGAAGVTAYVVFGRVYQYASGPAVVRVSRLELTARTDGVVAEISVRPGQHVSSGQPLLRFANDEARVQFVKQTERDLRLAGRPQSFWRVAAPENTTQVLAEMDLAAQPLSQQQVRAPSAGMISGVHVRTGQHLGGGELVVTLVADDARASLAALLPGRYRPILRPGTTLRFELSGYPGEYHDVAIDSIGDELLSPAEASHFLESSVNNPAPLAEPMVVVQATLPSRQFVSNGQTLSYFDGLRALAEVRVRKERIVHTILPVWER